MSQCNIVTLYRPSRLVPLLLESDEGDSGAEDEGAVAYNYTTRDVILYALGSKFSCTS